MSDSSSGASSPLIEDITELCDFCILLTRVIVDNSQHAPGIRGECYCIGEVKDSGGPKSCRLCETLTAAFCDARSKNGVEEPFTIADLKQHVSYGWTMSQTWSCEERNRFCGTAFGTLNFLMWADKDSPACATLTDRAPILGPGMKYVCELVQYWRQKCSTHERCIPECETQMPTRVLALQGDGPRPWVQLVETKGQKGLYVALSHCWGSAGKQPLRTTAETYTLHQRGIAFEDLPKTFQDVVTLAKGVGITNIWIDSLCIIQGDAADWQSEAAKMGAVYRNAALVVAASGAKNSSEGLFITNRPRATIMRLPYKLNSKLSGIFNMMQAPDETHRHPSHGPLERRAWTLQERYLAHRFVTFMPHGISWFCATDSKNEVGGFFFSFGQDIFWPLLLRKYTHRRLTFPSDRTEALRGIAEDFQREREDWYLSRYGVWEKDLVLQMLWTHVSARERDGDVHDLPSWSWAATTSEKAWAEEGTFWEYEDIVSARQMPERMVIDSTGIIRAVGHLSIQPRLCSVQYEAVLSGLSIVDSMMMRFSFATEEDKQSVRLLVHNTASGKEVLGIARFDGPEAGLHVQYFTVLQVKRGEGWGRSSDSNTKIIDGTRYHVDLNPAHVYWALLLARVDGGRYRRVGVAILLPLAYEVLQVELQEFEII